jgi:hypothetical protein
MVPLIFVALSLLAIVAEAQSNPAKAHEYIRVVQENGVWWFQDGSGHRFLSLGVNCVGGCYGHAEETPINPARKARILSALRDWGFNTVGSWSSPSLWDELYMADRIYTDFSEITHDVFDESFWSGGMADRLKAEVQPFLGIKNFVGYFLDNEPGWNAEQVVDGDVSEWPKELALKPAFVTALTDEMKVDHTYFMGWDKRYVYLAGDIRDSRLDHPGKDQAWQGDYLCVHFHPAKAADSRTDASSTICIYPQGGGADGQQPYASRRYGPQGGQEIAIQVKRRLRPGGYTVEARIPATEVWGFKGQAGALWKIKLIYQNVNEIYRTDWEGLVTLRHGTGVHRPRLYGNGWGCDNPDKSRRSPLPRMPSVE